MNEESVSTTQVEFTLTIGTGKLDASLQVASDTVTITQLLPVFQTFSSNVIDSVVRIVEQEGHQISCKAGCGACCRQLVAINLFEAEFLGNWIRSLPADKQDALEQRFNTALRQLSSSGVLSLISTENWGRDEAEVQEIGLKYFSAKVPCPFLENESCGIHPIRPLICREYLVTSPAEFCNDPAAYPVVGVPMPVKVSKTLVRLSAQVEKSSRGWLPLVFLFAWMRAQSRPGDAIVGPGPEILHEVVKRLST